MLSLVNLFFYCNFAKIYQYQCLIKTILQFIRINLEVFKIEIHNSKMESSTKKKEDMHEEVEKKGEAKIKVEKIETCYFCHNKFDINKDDLSHYKYGKYPMCAYCAEFYGFYSD